MKLEEEFLHFIWQNRLFNQSDLFIGDQKIEIIHPGSLNIYSGPDFSFSKIKIGDTTWAGNLEIHLKTSDWYKHNHQKDIAYQNLILHVVYENDLDDENLPPVLELKNRIPKSILQNYSSLKKAKTWLPCDSLFNLSNPIKNSIWLERILIERLERKTLEIEEIFKETNKDFEQSFFIFLSRAFGLKANGFPFELLAKNTPLKVLLKYSDQPIICEAILMGQAGFLDFPLDEYSQNLKKQYEFYKIKHELNPISKRIWKTGGVRPYNQPTLKIFQLSQLIVKLFPVSEKIIENDFQELEKLFKLKTSGYWDTHFVIGKVSNQKVKSIGQATINTLIINSIVPYLFFISRHRDKPHLKEIALGYLEQIAPENNSIIKKWEAYEIEIKSALDTQSLLEQRNEYCKLLQCLKCGIGNQIIKSA